MKVKVSVIIPTYNRVGVIGETLDSVIAQTLTDWECIVVDDGSNDGTDELLREYQQKDDRIKYIKRPSKRKKGGNSCRNIGLEQASGMFIQFLDSDDLISPNKLEEQVRALENSDSNAIATCKWGEFTNSKEQLSVKRYRPTYISAKSPIKLFDVFGKFTTFLLPHVFLVRKSVIDTAGYWNEDLIINQDGEFFTRVLLCSSEIVFVPTAEVYYRISSGDNVSSLSNEEKARGMITSWRLIDTAIRNNYGISNHAYVRQAKTGLFKKLKDKFPRVVAENNDFFRSKHSIYQYLSIKIVSRLQLLYYEKFKSIF